MKKAAKMVKLLANNIAANRHSAINNNVVRFDAAIANPRGDGYITLAHLSVSPNVGSNPDYWYLELSVRTYSKDKSAVHINIADTIALCAHTSNAKDGYDITTNKIIVMLSVDADYYGNWVDDVLAVKGATLLDDRG